MGVFPSFNIYANSFLNFRWPGRGDHLAPVGSWRLRGSFNSSDCSDGGDSVLDVEA